MAETVETTTEQRPIGASSVAGVLGISPYQSPWSVWAKLVGLPVADPANQDRLDAGTDAESFLAAQFNRHKADDGLECQAAQKEVEHVDYPWLRGRHDGVIVDLPQRATVLAGWEAKTSTDLRPWDEVPDYYQAQVQTYMLLSGFDDWWVTVGFGNWKVRHYHLTADAEDQATIIERTRTFWTDNVLAGIAPDVDGSDATSAALQAAYGHIADADDILFADDKLAAVVDGLRFWRAQAKEAEGEAATYENALKAYMQDCAVLVDPAGVPLVTWKASTSHRTDLNALRADHPDLCEKYVTATTTRRFLLKTIKGE